MSPLLGSIGGISEYNYRGNLDDWPTPFSFGNLTNIEPGAVVGISTVITGINYKSGVTASTGSFVSVRNIIGITSIYSGNSIVPSITATVSIAKSTTDLTVGTNIRILNIDDSNYNGEFVISSIIDAPYVTRFTYNLPLVPNNARPGVSTAQFNHEVYPFTENQQLYIRNNQILEVRIPTTSGTSSDFDKQYRTTVKVGKRYADWGVRTREKDDTPDTFSFNTVSGMNVGIATTSNSIILSGLENGFSSYAFISSGIGSFSVNGSIAVTNANVSNNDIIFMNEVSSEYYSDTKSSAITVGTFTTSFSVQTRNVDKTLDQFNFNSLLNVPINEDQVSISTSLSGADINIPLETIVSNPGELKVNSDNYVSGSTEVFNGDTVTLKIPAAAIKEYGTTYSTQLIVSGISSSFFVTTRPRPIKTFPDQFAFSDILSANPSTLLESSLITLTGMTVGVADTGLATITGGGSEFRVFRDGSLIRDYNSSSFPVKNSDQIQLKVLSAGEASTVQSRFTVSGVDTRTVINGVNGSTSDTWDVISRLLICKIDETSFRSALTTVSNAKIRELRLTSFTVSGLDGGCDTVITTSNPDSYIRNQNGVQVGSLQSLDIKNGDIITIYMTAAATYETNKFTTVECKRKNGSDLISGTWTIRTQLEDKLPDPFDLPTRNQNDVSPCTYRSTFVTTSLSGLSEETIIPASVTSTNNTAEISKNGGIFGTSIVGGVKNGDRIDIRLKSNCNFGGPCEVATVTVGERTDTWTVCPQNVALPTVTLQANSTSIPFNGSLTLTWTSTSATSVTSSSGTGFVGIGSTQGTITINNLKSGGTYSITVSNVKGSATSSVNINVAPEPTPKVTLTASPSTITSGGQSTLSWSSLNAVQVVSTSGAGFSNILTLSGSRSVSPTSNTLYSITVENSSGVRSTASVNVFVEPPLLPPTVSLSSPNLTSGSIIRINPGGSVILNWSSTNATSVSSYAGFGFIPTSTSGSVTISNINQNTSYTITVSGPGGTATSNTIQVLLNAPTITLSANPTTVNHNGSTTLTWSSTNATSVQSSNFGASSVSGALTLSNLTSTTTSSTVKTYNIIVSGPGGTATASVNVTILPPGPSVTLTANPSSVPYNGSTILSWTSSNASSVQSSNFGAATINGSISQSNLTSNRTYTITVVALDGRTATSTANVTVGTPPPTVDLCATNFIDESLPVTKSCATERSVGYESQVRLEWSSTNATSVVSVSGPSFLGITATSGSFNIPNPITSTTTYSITVSGPGGTATDSIRIVPNPCVIKTTQDTFANYTLGYVLYNNGIKDNILAYFTSSKSIAYTTTLPLKSSYTYGQVQDYISNYYRNVLGRPVNQTLLNNWTNTFNTNSSLQDLNQLGDLIINDYVIVSKEFAKVSSYGGRNGTYNTCGSILFIQSSSSFTRLYGSAGTYEFIVPPNVTSIEVSGVAGGGGGGTSRQDDGTSAGSGGGGGGSFRGRIGVTPGQVLNLRVGLGGNGAPGGKPPVGSDSFANTFGQAGESTFVNNFNSLLDFVGPLLTPSSIECGGGQGGSYTPGAAGGVGGPGGNAGQTTGKISSDGNSRAGAGGGAGLIGVFGNAGFAFLGASNGGISGCNKHGGSGGNGIDITTGLNANNGQIAICCDGQVNTALCMFGRRGGLHGGGGGGGSKNASGGDGARGALFFKWNN